MIGNLGYVSGMKVFVDKNCYTEIVKRRAVAVVVDARRPNRVKPIYKMKTFRTRIPRAYMVKGVGVIMHPEIYNRLQAQITDSFMKQEREAIASAFGVPSALWSQAKKGISNVRK